MAKNAPEVETLETEILALCRKIVHPTVELETNLIEEGLLDSFHTLKLVTQLEDTYQVTIELSTLGAEDIHSVKAMAAFVRSRILTEE